jgi:hypothetical protein
MLSRQTHYGLLVCLVALLALGSPSFCAGKLSAELPGTMEDAPAEESQDEEEESETEAVGLNLLRRRDMVTLPPSGGICLRVAIQSSRTPRPHSFFAPRSAGEQTARNGIGGPLRL